MKSEGLVVVRGGGDLGSGVAHRLARSGYRVVVLEMNAPSAVRRKAAFAEAVFAGETTVEGVSARRIERAELDRIAWAAAGWPGWIPVVIDPDGETIRALGPAAVVDARMAKRNLGTSRGDAPLTIGLGPGFTAGRDVDFVVETRRGHTLGRVLSEGAAEPDTGVPGEVAGFAAERVLRAPVGGAFQATAHIGAVVRAGDVVGFVDGSPVRAGIPGLVRGLVADGVVVVRGQKLGDVDPRGSGIDPGLVSDKARAIGGAVLEALLSRGVLPPARTSCGGTG
jgi:xanthine dehydrogenase accessory factor